MSVPAQQSGNTSVAARGANAPERDAKERDAKPVVRPGDPESAEPVPRETGGPRGPEPTRYGDWERGGRCIDF